MKNKYWIAVFVVIVAACLALVFVPSSPAPSESAQIKYGSNALTVSLSEDREYTFAAENGGYNTVTVRDGKIAVTAADCPDGYCMDRGFCDDGAPIVCLPHKLVIEFVGEQEIDGLIG